MPRITFYKDGQTFPVDAEPGMSLLTAARRAGVLVESPCNGNGTCGKCRVKLVNAAHHQETIAQPEAPLSFEQNENIVLACQTHVGTDMAVAIMRRNDGDNVQILQYGQNLDLPTASLIRKVHGKAENMTAVFAGYKQLGTEQGNTARQNYGMVVDIGTTTLVTALFNLDSGQELAVSSALNPQSHHAQDVLSRIKYASDQDGLQVMHDELIAALNQMIGHMTDHAAVHNEHIYEIIFSGNTCMLHLAVKANPFSLGKFPYTPVITGGAYYPAGQIGLHVAPFAQVYLPPVISAYVGADITSGILAAQLKEREGLTLFVDIGTNGEMVLAHDGDLIATSTAAGPAFEGMNITCGMRAAPGAIEKFRITGKGTAEIKTIGDQAPLGICGSGLIDIVGELVKHGIVTSNGKLSIGNSDSPVGKKVIVKDGKPVFQISNDVYLSQKDIRQVQLAKGAIRAGIEALLAQCGVQPGDVSRVLIAGSFGYHLNTASLIHIGLLPPAFAEKVDFLGNTSKTGGQALLLNYMKRAVIEKVVPDVNALELATTENFDKLFIRCLTF